MEVNGDASAILYPGMLADHDSFEVRLLTSVRASDRSHLRLARIVGGRRTQRAWMSEV